MAAFAFQLNFVSVGIDAGLGLQNGGNGFKSNAEINILSVGNTALNAAGMIGSGLYVAVFVLIELVVVLRAGHAQTIKPGSEIEAFYGVYAQHGFAKFSVQ